MKALFIGAALAACFASTSFASGLPSLDSLITGLETATVSDFQTAEAIAEANPNDPFTPAAEQCFKGEIGYFQSASALSFVAPTGPISFIEAGVVGINDLSSQTTLLPEHLNKNCSWYIADLKQAAAKKAVGIVLPFKLPFGL